MAKKAKSIDCLGAGLVTRCERTASNSTKEVLGKTACISCIEKRMVELEQQAKYDKLTGLLNNLGMAEKFEETRKAGKALGMIFIDLTSFKHVNETNGHTGGDIALRWTAWKLENGVRHDTEHGLEDVVFSRKGGDEILMLVDLTPRKEAGENMTEQERLQRTASHVRTKFAANKPLTHYNHNDVTPSKRLDLRMGMAVHEEGMSLEDLVTAADPKGPSEVRDFVPGIQMMHDELVAAGIL